MGYKGKVYAYNWDNVGKVIYGKNSYVYPAGEMSVEYSSKCKSSCKTQTMTSSSEVQKSFKASVAIGGSGTYNGIDGEFTASASYH